MDDRGAREITQHGVVTRYDAELDAILARNGWTVETAGLVAFVALGDQPATYTADRREFIGRNGSLAAPAALERAGLAETTGGGLDPCAVLQTRIELPPGARREVVVLLGAGHGEEEAASLVRRYREPAFAEEEARRSVAAWDKRLGVIQARTPDPLFDAMLNRWALYQALACRMWGRSAVYQSSGAYGFRDQLQDCMAFVYSEPGIAREQIVRAAGRQFPEGDVQHWWHPETGRGVRTRFSDDLAWLPWVVHHYLRVTGDASVLDEQATFISMRALEPHEHEFYDLPEVLDKRASVYEHCLLALERACTTGAHGLPLMGIGDWNDGMNRVGHEGRGESVWLAWFLVRVLRDFATVCDDRGDGAKAAKLRARAVEYGKVANRAGWDGEWYRRAYFDDGSVLGSAANDECRIDSIAQSWSVISGAGDPDKQSKAMTQLDRHLVRRDARLLMLLTPAFDRTPNDPGYIKGYLPGVRENGAQYTHAALWAVLAAVMRGDGDRAYEYFQMINPLTHARSPQEVAIYKVEPYVVSADVYTADGHLGRGGWTWYTGSASWFYRVALEGILGFTLRGDRLTMNPCLPREWDGFSLEYRHGETPYVITVRNPEGVARGVRSVTVDGEESAGREVRLVDDGRRREVVVEMGESAATTELPAGR